jgi:hypothetical protein
MQVGEEGSHAGHAKNPISLHDVFFRVGGAGRAAPVWISKSTPMTPSSTTHGSGAPITEQGAGWTTNPSANGLVVNGNNVTAYGLFVEHHQQYQVLWNGNGGRTYFYQSEIPYDPPDQAELYERSGREGRAHQRLGVVQSGR